jgi:gamma-tubulin complex component 2
VDLNDKYWLDRFTYREEMVPIFLAKHQQKILQAGKYLNVIRECGRLDIKNPYEEEMVNHQGGFTFTRSNQQNKPSSSVDHPMLNAEDEESKEEHIDTSSKRQGGDHTHTYYYDFYEPIERAYEWNSARLLEMIFGECELLNRLESINHYFFFDRGDLFSHFYDGCGDILEKQSSDVKIEKLESCLEMAIRTSSANSDPFKDDVTCELNGYGMSE